ncbi:MAG: hypothetical protein GY842_20895 [bacterium]|nr:hypothetical protein [bacterium]
MSTDTIGRQLTADRSAWPERWWVWLTCLLVLLTVVVGLSLVSSAWSASPDAVKYAVTARSLARGDGYMFNGGPETKHPPGFSLLLVPLFWAKSDPFRAARIVTVLAAGGALALAGVLLRRELGAGVALAALVCVASSVQLYWSAQAVLSEYPYALFQNLALILLVKVGCARRPRIRDVLLFGMLAGAAMLLRSIGLALVVAAAYVLIRRRLGGRLTNGRTAVLGGLGVGIPALMFGAWRLYATAQTSIAIVPENVHILLRGYSGAAGVSAWATIVQTAQNMLSQAGGLVFGQLAPGLYPSIESFIWIGLLLLWIPVPIALIVRGLIRAEPIWMFLLVYLGLIAFWPLASNATARLCWPVTPLVVGVLLSSWGWLGTRVWRRRGSAVVLAVLLGGMLLGQVTLSRHFWAAMRDGEEFWTARRADLTSIREEFHPTVPDRWGHLNVRESVYVFDMPTTVMEFTWGKDPERWAWEIDEYLPNYVVVPTTPVGLANAQLFVETLQKVRPETTRIRELDTVSLYRVLPATPQD